MDLTTIMAPKGNMAPAAMANVSDNDGLLDLTIDPKMMAPTVGAHSLQ